MSTKGNNIIEINPTRVEYMMNLFRLSEKDFLNIVNEDVKNNLTYIDIVNEKIKLSNLKKIDKIFGKGLSFYTDPKNIKKNNSESIFFRKKEFNVELNIEDKKRVNSIENEVSYISSLLKLTNHTIDRKLKKFSIKDSPRKVALENRDSLLPKTEKIKDREFLVRFIDKLSDCNILILEFIENHNQKNKANIEGFFIEPNVISIKRNQKSFKREIFTLAHELGHYFLDKEELDTSVYSSNEKIGIEHWCNEFAFYFLAGDVLDDIVDFENIKYDDKNIDNISQRYHISRLALFTNLFIGSKISSEHYNYLKEDLEIEFKNKKAQKEILQDKDTETFFSPPKRIFSNLEKNIYANAYIDGVINEYDILSRFKIKDFDKFVYG